MSPSTRRAIKVVSAAALNVKVRLNVMIVPIKPLKPVPVIFRLPGLLYRATIFSLDRHSQGILPKMPGLSTITGFVRMCSTLRGPDRFGSQSKDI